jgi:hypothetical protein
MVGLLSNTETLKPLYSLWGRRDSNSHDLAVNGF